MANLSETPIWENGIYQIETTDPVVGGAPNIATKAGLSNIPNVQLANRTSWLKSAIDAINSAVNSLGSSIAGLVPAARKVETSGLATGGGPLDQDRTISVAVATNVEAEAGITNTKASTPAMVAAQVGKANSAPVKAALNAVGVAPVYAARAWASFQPGASPSIASSRNVASITRLATGQYQITWATAMPASSYAVLLTSNREGGVPISAYVHSISATAVVIYLVKTSDGTFADDSYVAVAAFA